MDGPQTILSVPHPAPMLAEGPIPMSFPAILRNPGLSDRFAHLRIQSRPAPVTSVSGKRNRRDDKEGKRWVRRKENARFVGNVHIVAPAKKDLVVPITTSQPTFPEPLPNFLSRNNPIPAAVPTVCEPASANAGRFSLSLKGARRQLRNSGPRIELLVKELEDVILDWLATGGVLLSPGASTPLNLPGKPIGSTEAVREISRTPLQLVWNVEDNAFTRYVVHCCARYHEVVSFSKDAPGQRLTYLLRPNVTRPTRYAAPTLDTPPVTDLSELSATDFDTEPEVMSDRSDMSDAEDAPASTPARSHALTAIVEVASAFDSDGWSVIGESDADAEGDMSAHEPEGELADSVASLSLGTEGEPALERTPLADRRRQGPEVLRSRLWDRQRRSASSPSRSPARRAPPRATRSRAEVVAPSRPQPIGGRRSFYNYLYA